MKKTVRKHYLKLVEWSAEDGLYVGRCPELFYGGVHGSDETKVYRELCKVVDEVVAMKTTHGDPLPEPLGDREFSGKFVLRVSPAIHRQITLQALAEGQSLNTYCAERLAGAVENGNAKRNAAAAKMPRTAAKRRRAVSAAK